ncbi:NADH-quinone oxidoreductase subunit J [candidate division KSB1 bacterium]|nr:NADH-quinone oxidoreductase subunit J [candidate division KSB1 bacterium]
MIPILFFLFAAVAIASGIMMIVHRNPIYCALFLILTLFAVAGLYVLLNAPFIAAVHIIVYAGAIMVLFLFVIMLLDIKSESARQRPGGLLRVLSIVVSGVLFAELVLFLRSGTTNPPLVEGDLKIGSTKEIGNLLFTEYLFPFEITSVLLLSAIIGSVILAKLKLK